MAAVRRLPGVLLRVGIIWLNHHAVIRLLDRADHTLQVLNLLVLLPVSVLPWPTAVLAEYLREGTTSDQRVAVLLYGLTSSATGVAFNLLWRGILRHPEHWRADVDRRDLAVRNRRFNIGVGLYPAATLLGLLSTPLFLVLVFALALLYLLPTPDVREP